MLMCHVRYADDAQGLTWGGLSYETKDGKVAGEPDVKVVPVSAGLDISATEAVMLSFE